MGAYVVETDEEKLERVKREEDALDRSGVDLDNDFGDEEEAQDGELLEDPWNLDYLQLPEELAGVASDGEDAADLPAGQDILVKLCNAFGVENPNELDLNDLDLRPHTLG